MSRRVSIAEARDQLTEMVNAAESSSPRNLWSAIQEFRQTHDLSDLNVEDVYAGLRDPSPCRDLDE